MPDSQIHIQASQDGRRYALNVEAVDGGHQVELVGCDADGQVLLDWRGTLPAAADLGVLARLLTAAAAVTGVPAPRPAATVAQQRARHANAARPWTAADDERLAELAAQPGTTIPDLMREFGRSRGAIRARLEKKVPGCSLLQRPAAVAP